MRADRARQALLICALLAVVAGCDVSKRNPVGPEPPGTPPGTTPPPALPPAPTDVRVAALDTVQRTAVIQWSASEGAERYAVEYGPLFDGNVRTTVMTDGPETTIMLRDLSGVFFEARVRAGSSNGFGPRSPGVTFQIPVFNDAVEALFFGTGPYGTGFFAAPGTDDYFVVNEAHVQAGTMLGWRAGTIPVRVEEALNGEQTANLVRILAQVRDLTSGEVRGEIVERSAAQPDQFQPGELRVIVRDDISNPCGQTALGCAPQFLVARGEIVAARIHIKSNASADLVSHEVGHALLGLHHVSGVHVPARPVMAPSPGRSETGFSALEFEAIRAVYAAGLRHGATRADFYAKGLISNQ